LCPVTMISLVTVALLLLCPVSMISIVTVVLFFLRLVSMISIVAVALLYLHPISMISLFTVAFFMSLIKKSLQLYFCNTLKWHAFGLQTIQRFSFCNALKLAFL
jgi:hypothetical protein